MLASGPDSVRFRPALTVSREEIDAAVDAVRGALKLDLGRLRQPPDRRPQPGQLGAADEFAAVQLREFACRRCEFVVGDHHGPGAILHRRARHHLLHGARADRAGLPFALNGKAIGPLPTMMSTPQSPVTDVMITGTPHDRAIRAT